MSLITSRGEIAVTYERVATAVSDLVDIRDTESQSVPAEPSEYDYGDERQRLEIWAREHGVQEGRLDYKLREASPLQERVLSLLTALLHETVAATDPQSQPVPNPLTEQNVINEHDESLTQEPWGGPDGEVETDRVEACSVTSQSSSGIDTNISLGDSLPDTPVARIHDTITLLLELGPTLLNPVPHDRLGYAIPDEAAQYDLDYVRTKFPKAKPNLIARVGRANFEKRQALRNQRAKCEKFTGPVIAPDASSTKNQAENAHARWSMKEQHNLEDEILSQTESAPSQISTDSDVAISTASQSEKTGGSESIFSKPKAESTQGTEPVLLHRDMIQGEVSTQPKHMLQAPPHPNEEFRGEPFLCPFCFRYISGVTSSRQWKNHVFEDLEPYICTYETCTMAGKTYGTKADWWHHETEKHRMLRHWRCSPCKELKHDSTFASAESFDEHVRNHHRSINEEQLVSIRRLCQEVTGTTDPADCCPFCQEGPLFESSTSSGKKKRVVMKHVSKHFEQLVSFVAFPAGQMIDDGDDSEFVDDSDPEWEYKTEIESIVSDPRGPSRYEIRRANVDRFIANQERTTIQSKCGESPDRQDSQPPSGGEIAQPLFPVHVLLHPPNEHFYGRKDLIREADKMLSTKGSICIFHGVGGIGKTLAANEYVYKNRDHYDAVFWLQADTFPSLADSFIQMATALGLISSSDDHLQAMDRGRNWLQETANRWLVVFDNALAWDQISPFMPNSLQTSNGSILITTQRAKLVRDSPNITKLRIDPLDPETGSEVLLKYLNKDIEHDPERHLAREISTFIGGLPIAIAHIAGFAEESKYCLEELIEVFREWRKRTGIATDEADDLPMSFREAAFSYDETLAMVWSVTLRDLTTDAQNVMNILAFLNGEAIQLKMLFTLHEHESLQFLDNREKVRLNRLQQSLVRRRLVVSKEVDGELCFSVHRSLQRGIRETLAQEKGKLQLVFDQTVALLREVFPQSSPLQQPMPDQWAEFSRLLPHLHSLRDVYNTFNPTIKGSVDFAQILSDAGMDHNERGITKEGLLLLQTAEEVLTSVSTDENHGLRANIHAMIGIMYDNTGIETRAEGLRRRKIALDIRKQIVERSKPCKRNEEILLYNSWMEFAISLLHYHRYDEAEPVIEKCLQKYREWGPESQIPFEYAKYYNKIALVRMYQGRFEESVELAERGAELMSQTGYVLFETRFRFDLACIILQSGDVDGALRVHHQIFDSRLEKLGQANELTLHSRYAIGAIYEIKGQYEEAASWFRKALGQRRGVSSWPDEAFARAQFHLSRVLQLQGDPDDASMAEGLRQTSLAVLHRLLPLDQPAELEQCQDDAVLFDHMLSVQGARFTGQGLLKYFSKSASQST